MRSRSGPCGLSAQRRFASSISSAAALSASAATMSALKARTAIPIAEACERGAICRAYRQDLEELAHLRRREQALRLRSERRVVQRVLHIRFPEHVGDAAIDEKLRLGRVAVDLRARRLSSVGEGAEVD